MMKGHSGTDDQQDKLGEKPPDVLYARLRKTKQSQMHLHLRLEGALAGAQSVEEAIQTSLVSLYGVVGAAMLHYEFVSTREPDTAVLEVPSEHCQRLWAGLTMLSSFNMRPARITVLRAIPI